MTTITKIPKVTDVRALSGYALEITFDDGTQGTVSLHDRLFGPVFEPLRDPDVFGKAFIDEFGAVAWPNGADLAPDALYQRLHAPAAHRDTSSADGTP